MRALSSLLCSTESIALVCAAMYEIEKPTQPALELPTLVLLTHVLPTHALPTFVLPVLVSLTEE